MAKKKAKASKEKPEPPERKLSSSEKARIKRQAEERSEALKKGEDLSDVYRKQLGEEMAASKKRSSKDTKKYVNKFAVKKDSREDRPASKGRLTDQERLIKARADKEEVLAKKVSEEVLDYEPMLKRWQDIGHSVKAKLMSIPGAVAVELSACKSAAQIERILEDQIRHAVEEIAKETFS